VTSIPSPTMTSFRRSYIETAVRYGSYNKKLYTHWVLGGHSELARGENVLRKGENPGEGVGQADLRVSPEQDEIRKSL